MSGHIVWLCALPLKSTERDQHTSMMASVYPDIIDTSEPLARQALKFTLVLGLHVALVTWLAYTQIDTPSQPAPLPLDVRMINTPPPEIIPKPLPQKRQPVVRQPEPITPPPVLTAAPNVNQDSTPEAFSVPTQPPPAPLQEVPVPSTDIAVTEARFDADYLQNPAPAYPALSRRQGEEGKVLLVVRVSAQGAAEQVQIKQSSGHSRLDEAALNALRQWRFVPARRGEEPIAASVVVPIVFRLGD